jgi:hypothetical protein
VFCFINLNTTGLSACPDYLHTLPDLSLFALHTLLAHSFQTPRNGIVCTLQHKAMISPPSLMKDGLSHGLAEAEPSQAKI